MHEANPQTSTCLPYLATRGKLVLASPQVMHEANPQTSTCLHHLRWCTMHDASWKRGTSKAPTRYGTSEVWYGKLKAMHGMANEASDATRACRVPAKLQQKSKVSKAHCFFCVTRVCWANPRKFLLSLLRYVKYRRRRYSDEGDATQAMHQPDKQVRFALYTRVFDFLQKFLACSAKQMHLPLKPKSTKYIYLLCNMKKPIFKTALLPAL